MSKKLLLILNPKAGQKRANRYLADIIEIFQKNGYDCTVRLTMKQGDGRNLVAKYGKKMDRIVCIGGDGTLNEVIDGLTQAQIDVPVGYIPAGSTNDFATSMNLSHNILQAARDIMTGEPQKLDVCSFNGRHYTYVASCGIFSAISYTTAQPAKNTLGKLAYLLEGMKDFSTVEPFEMCVRTEEGDVFEGQYIFAACSNSTSIGGVLEMDPEVVDMNDGKFEILLIQMPESIADLTMVIYDLRNQRYDSPYLYFCKTRHAVIEMMEPIDWTLDGERQAGSLQIQIRSIHDAYRLVVPPKK